ncbi:hypothetical protein D9756_004088 [Leucocoprinus leucothites]|uniref:Uncharacterized protein n=1 Tax=Leucocoprinus leucothites TaxID=201217 RepID=A0A8H5G0B6_9AGAR|nr:hypothetical protein D9756_004088 [Leucoagaricus leucothites]
MSLRYPPIPILELWLERSAHASLDIHFTDMGPLALMLTEGTPWMPNVTFTHDHAVQLVYSRDAIKALAAHAHHWEKFLYMCPSNNNRGFRLASLLTLIPFQDATRLTYFIPMVCSSREAQDSILNAIGRAPNLKTFYWTFPDPDYPTSRSLFPWHRLEELNLTGCTRQLSSIIPKCTSATRLHLDVEFYLPSQQELQPSMPLPVLKCLSISCHRDAFLLLRQIECRNLEVLFVRLRGEELEGFNELEDRVVQEFWEHFLVFLNSNHSLRLLQIEDMEESLIEEHMLKAFFTKTPWFTNLIGLKLTLGNADWAYEAFDLIHSELGETENRVADYFVVEGNFDDREEKEVVNMGWILEDDLDEFLANRSYIKKVTNLDICSFPGYEG